MAIYYDLHIHSALSPCGDDDMTPCNIINMAIIKGLDVLAVTDHNSAFNLPAIYEAAREKGIMLIFGLEVQTKEEVHMLCYFKALQEALKFGEKIYESLPQTSNDPNLFGHQYILDSKDNITGEVGKLLLSSSSYSLNQLSKLVRQYNGVMIPAHIDRTSYSIISNLGFIPDDLGIRTVEISKNENIDTATSKFPYLKSMNILRSSDAHYLGDISERENCMGIDEITMGGIFSQLKG